MKQDDDRIRDLYRQSASEQPPAHIDDAILAASRKAVSSSPRSAAPFSGRWQLPASLVAVVIVAVLLVPLLQQESREIEAPVPSVAAPSDTAVPVPPAVTPRDIAESAPPALMQQKVTEPKKRKAFLQEFAAPAREESETFGRARHAFMAEVPDQWLKKIEALVDKGREQRAVTELREFIRQYPEYPLPPGLEALRDKDK